MPMLLALPNELILDIISDFEYDRATLLMISRVCRRLHRIVRPFVFRHVSQEIYDAESEAVARCLYAQHEERQALLERSFDNDPSLREAVWTIGPMKSTYNNWASFISSSSLARFPNLKGMHLLHEPGAMETAQMFHILEHIPWARLQYVRFEDPDPREMIFVLFLPGIRKVEFYARSFGLRRLNDIDIWSSDDMEYSRDKVSSVQSLKFSGPKRDSQRGWSSEAMHQLLKCCPALADFSSDRPLAVNIQYDPRPWENDDKFRPSRILHALQPAHTTLRKLNIEISTSYLFKVLGPLLDLSPFSSLEEVRIDSICLMARGKPDPSADNLYQRLPRSLKFLQIDYREPLNHTTVKSECTICKVYERKNMPPLHLKTHDRIPLLAKVQSPWLLHLPTHKVEAFPKLERLVLEEHWLDAWLDGRRWEKSAWAAPKEIMKAYAEAMMELTVLLYA